MKYYTKNNELVFTCEQLEALAKAHKVLMGARDLVEHAEGGPPESDNYYSVAIAEGRLKDILDELTPANGLDVYK